MGWWVRSVRQVTGQGQAPGACHRSAVRGSDVRRHLVNGHWSITRPPLRDGQRHAARAARPPASRRAVNGPRCATGYTRPLLSPIDPRFATGSATPPLRRVPRFATGGWIPPLRDGVAFARRAARAGRPAAILAAFWATFWAGQSGHRSGSSARGVSPVSGQRVRYQGSFCQRSLVNKEN